jgi:hypothetical protein
MTPQEVEQQVQRIFDSILLSVTSAEPGGKPVFAPATTVLSLMKPGIAINPADFRLPWTPGNLNGSKDAAVNLANLADVAPKMSSVYTDSGNTVSQIYKQMLDGVAIPAQPANPAIEAQLAAADAVLFRNVDMIDDETGESVTRRIESQLYRDYLDNQNAYNAARMGYVGAYLEAQKTTTGKNTWPLLASTLQIPVRQAYDRWRAAGADKVEQAIAILNTSSQNALQKAFDNAKKTMEGYGVILEESGAGMAPTTYRVSYLPSNWFSTSSTGWTKYDSVNSSVSSSQSSDFKSGGGSASFSLGLFSIGGGGGHTVQSQQVSSETNSLRISFSYTMVTIRRPWLTFNLFNTRGWSLGNLYAKGKISNGTRSNQGASAMPLLPTAFIAVKDVVISANWSKTDMELIKKHSTGGGGFAIGPFSIGGTYTHSSSKQTYQSSIAGTKISVPGVQLIGTISQVVPLSPPA